MYEVYLWMVKYFQHEKIHFISSSQRVMFFLLYIDKNTSKTTDLSKKRLEMTSSISSLVRIWKICHFVRFEFIIKHSCLYYKYCYYMNQKNIKYLILCVSVCLKCMPPNHLRRFTAAVGSTAVPRTTEHPEKWGRLRKYERPVCKNGGEGGFQGKIYWISEKNPTPAVSVVLECRECLRVGLFLFFN